MKEAIGHLTTGVIERRRPACVEKGLQEAGPTIRRKVRKGHRIRRKRYLFKRV